jgi:4-hydroxyphenylpyruvate dioxygenase
MAGSAKIWPGSAISRSRATSASPTRRFAGADGSADYRDAWRVVKVAAHDHVGVMLDCFHIFALDLPLDGIDEIPADKIFLVEIADMPKINLDLIEVSRHYRLFPGEGVMPAADFVRRVRRGGYAGPYSLEIFNAHCRATEPGLVAERAMRSMTLLFSDLESP